MRYGHAAPAEPGGHVQASVDPTGQVGVARLLLGGVEAGQGGVPLEQLLQVEHERVGVERVGALLVVLEDVVEGVRTDDGAGAAVLLLNGRLGHVVVYRIIRFLEGKHREQEN